MTFSLMNINVSAAFGVASAPVFREAHSYKALLYEISDAVDSVF
jgi:hypothetical protein